MKIFIERKYKKEDYTIGSLFINGKWVCNTLELTDRGITQVTPLKNLYEIKVPCKTAIPTGTYFVKLQFSHKFRAKRPYILSVPGFFGIMIHEGNEPKDTLGCILVGMNREKGRVLDSRECLGKIDEAIMKAEERCEPVVITIR